MEDKVATAQRQARLALARAVRAEQEADQVPFLEQQLSQSKANLKEQIRMQDGARVAAQQQFDQTKAALRVDLDCQLKEKEQGRMILQHQLQEQERARVSLETHIQAQNQELEQQLHRKDEDIRTLLQSQSEQVSAVAQSQPKFHRT